MYWATKSSGRNERITVNTEAIKETLRILRAHFYTCPKHVVRPGEPSTQTFECLGFLASYAFRTRVPLAPLCGYPNKN